MGRVIADEKTEKKETEARAAFAPGQLADNSDIGFTCRRCHSSILGIFLITPTSCCSHLSFSAFKMIKTTERDTVNPR